MKRTPLKRVSALRRSAQPLRREAKLRSRKWRKRETDTELAGIFRRAVLGRDALCVGLLYSDEPCDFAGAGVDYDPAHLIPAGTLRKRGLSEAVVYDPRNGVAMCRRHHRRNDDAVERIPAGFVPLRARAFAREHGLEDLLERLYGAWR